MSKELHDLLTEMVKLYQERQCFLAVHAERLCALLPAAPEAPAPVPLPDRETALGLLTAAAKDAERYRWLRHGDNDEEVLRFHDWATEVCVDPPPMYLPRLERLDRLIDAARKEQTNG
jgi:hypothetical protein